MTTRRTPLTDISNNDVMSSPVATEGSRRKSGRAVRVPQKFVPEAPGQVGTANAKRKRGAQDTENDASDIEEVSEESDDSESAGEDEDRARGKKSKTKPVRKPAAKKPKVNGTRSHGNAPAVQLPSRPKKVKKTVIVDDTAEGLYAEVFASEESLEDVASQWLSRHEQDARAALTDFVNFLLKCCGCNIEVTGDDIDDADHVGGRLSDIQGEYQAQNIVDYPLISKSKTSHAWRTSFVGFFDHLLAAMHESEVLYDDQLLLENIHVWVVSMTSSASRPFRHTATLVALTMISSFCKITNKQIEENARVLRQFEGEKNKKTSNKARVVDFQKKLTSNEQKKTFVEGQLQDYYDSVYVNRYRDVDARIRLECVEALGTWILTLPSHFFEGQYLRYMGWMLSDTHGPMRLEVVKQLLKIMKNPENHGQMRHFIERFRPRLIEMAICDSEANVRAYAVDLADRVRQAGFLEPDDIDTIGKLIFDAEPKVRKALVGFFAENIKDLYEAKVDELGGEEALEDIMTVEDEEDFDTPRAGWIRYKCLAEILSSYDNDDSDNIPEENSHLVVNGAESRFSLAAQALYEEVPELQDWETLAGYLLFDHTSRITGNQTEKALKSALKPNEEEELILLDILNAVVKLSLSHVENLDKTKDKTKKKSGREDMTEEMETAARRLASLIPRLLKKYGPDPKTATIVLRLEHVLNLNIFQELRQDSTAFAKLLDDISAQFNAHTDSDVLKEAGAAFLHARAYEELDEITESKFQSLWDDAISTLRKINKVGEISVRASYKTKILTELSHNLARLDQLSSISSPVEYFESATKKDDTLPIAILLDVIARGVFEESTDGALDILEDEVVLSAMRCALFYFMWKTRGLIEAVGSDESIADLEIDHLKEWQETFFQNLTAAFSSRSTLDPVRLLGAGTLLDAHTLFASLRSLKRGKGGSSRAKSDGDILSIQNLIQEIIPEVQAELRSIFEGLEKNFAKRSNKTLADPSEDEEPEDLEDEPEDEDDDDETDSQETLRAEKELCEFTGKLVLAIHARVLDASGPLKGKFRRRIERNRARLGPNFKEVVAYLDDAKSKGTKSHKSKAQQAAIASRKTAKSTELVEEEDEEDGEFDIEPEEGTVEDLRRRELLEEEPEEIEDEHTNGDHDVDDEIMGD